MKVSPQIIVLPTLSLGPLLPEAVNSPRLPNKVKLGEEYASVVPAHEWSLDVSFSCGTVPPFLLNALINVAEPPSQ